MKVLVTGANGFVGRALVPTLSQSGHEVVAFVRTGRPVPGAQSTVYGDMTDSDSLARALPGIDAVVHLAGAKSDEPDSREVNVGGMHNLIRACRTAGVGRIIYISTASAKIARPGAYGATKREAEEVLLKSDIAWTILRPSLIYDGDAEGAFGALVGAARLPVIPVFGDGMWVSRPVHVDDVARAIEITLSNKALLNRAYDVGGPDAISFDVLLQMIRCDLLHRSHAYILHISPRIGITTAKILRFLTRKPPITESNVLGSTQDISWDGDVFFKESGFTPRSLAEGFRDIVRIERKNELLREARVLYAYVYSRSGFRAAASRPLQERYAGAIIAAGLGPVHSLLVRASMWIGPLDAATKLFAPTSPLRKRLLIMSALVEADPKSVRWLYPRDRSVTMIIIDTILLGCSAGIKIIMGSLLALVPGFLKTYAG